MLYDHTKRCVDLSCGMTVYVATCGTEAFCDATCRLQDCLEDFCVSSYRNGTCLANAQCTGVLPVEGTVDQKSQSELVSRWEDVMKTINYVLIGIGCVAVVVAGCALFILEQRGKVAHTRVSVEGSDEKKEEPQQEGEEV